MIKPVRLLVLIVLLFLSAGCSTINSGIASLQSTSDFVPLKSDPRILYEPGAEDIATIVAQNLNDAMQKVESKQYLPFAEPVEIMVSATDESHQNHIGQGAKAVHIRNRIWLSGRFKDEPQSIPPYLTHELSHLHLYQRIGWYHFLSDLPPWFVEGLAVWVSDGGGAGEVSEAEAARSIIAGKHFTPDAHGSFFSRKYGSAFGLDNHMFYRQGAMFVGYLYLQNPEGFKQFLLYLQNKQRFEESFARAFKMSVTESWQSFVVGLHNIARNDGH